MTAKNLGTKRVKLYFLANFLRSVSEKGPFCDFHIPKKTKMLFSSKLGSSEISYLL